MFLKTIIASAALAAMPLTATAATHTVHIKYNNFLPHHLIVNVGDEVEWIHESTLDHKITTFNEDLTDGKRAHVPAGGERFRSEILIHGSNYKHTFATPGLYKYVCPIHPHKMFGYIEVVEGGDNRH